MGFVRDTFPMGGYALAHKAFGGDKKKVEQPKQRLDLSGQPSLLGGAPRRSLY